MTDCAYFIRTYCKLQHPVRGEIPFELYPYQEEILDLYTNNRQIIVLSARQTGKSQVSAAYLLWFAIFNDDKTILIASNKNDNAMEMIRRIKFMYERLPHWLKPGIMEDGWNAHKVGFDNGSTIHSTATTENSGRGMSISLLFLDEFAFVRETVQDEFWTSIAPTLATGGACIITSTPNGDTNLFAQLWRGANIPVEDGAALGVNGFIPKQIRWDEPPGRDEEFKRKEIAKIGEIKWLQEYECVFVSSDPLLINTITLSNLTGILEKVTAKARVGHLTFFHKPAPNKTYLVGVDPATGTGQDYTVFEVFQFPEMIQVAEYRSNTTSPITAYNELKKLLRALKKFDSVVYFTIENNGIGEGMLNQYEMDEFPPEDAEFISEEGKRRKGMYTTARSKALACLRLKEMLEKGLIEIRSKALLAELKHFIRAGGSYRAKRGATDDCISGTLLVLRLITEISEYEQDAHDMLYSSEDEGTLYEEVDAIDWGDSSGDGVEDYQDTPFIV